MNIKALQLFTDELFNTPTQPKPMTYDEWASIGLVNGWLGVRANDPATSIKAAQSLWVRAGSQRARLLAEYAPHPITDEEAGNFSELAMLPKCCYWKRCSELRQAGYIIPTGEFRQSSAGVDQQVCAITEAGREILDSIK